jgi:hypothetical protein
MCSSPLVVDAFPKAQLPDLACLMRLQQGFAAGEMGFRVSFAQQQSSAAHVRFGSFADIEAPLSDVRFTPKADISRRGYRRHMLASQGCLSGGKPAGR